MVVAAKVYSSVRKYFDLQKLTNYRFWMTRCIVEKKNDFSVRKYELPVKTCQYSFHYSDVGQYLLGFEKKWTLAGRYRSCSFLKQHGGLLFQMTMGWSIFTPAAQTKKVTVNRCVDFLPPFACFPFSTNPLFGRALKNSQICPYSKCFPVSFQSIRLSCLSRKWPFL